MSTLFQFVPTGWHRASLRYLAQGPKNGAWGSEAGEDEIDAICVRVADFDWSHLTLKLDEPTTRSFKKQQFKNLRLVPGDIVIEKSGGGEKTPVGRVVSFDEHIDAVTSNFVARIRPRENVWNRYFLYLLAAHYMSGYSHQFIKQNTGIQNLDDTNLFRSEVWIPDLATQRRIADFLDRETARIDLLIEKKQRLVVLLAAKREALRDTAICRGLSADATMKASGIDWFGHVPAHWTICRFNRLIASKVDYRGRTPEKVDEGIFLVTARNIRSGRIDYERSEEYTTEEDWEKLSARGKPRIGDVLFTTEAPLGQIAQVDRTDVAFAQRIMKFRANEALVTNDFLAELMMSASFQRSLQLYSSGSTAAGIKSERLVHLFAPVPPMAEQLEIVHFVRREFRRLDSLEEPIDASIDRLKEFRSALITAAVTGQIDVTSWGRRGEADRRLDRLEAGAAE